MNWKRLAPRKHHLVGLVWLLAVLASMATSMEPGSWVYYSQSGPPLQLDASTPVVAQHITINAVDGQIGLWAQLSVSGELLSSTEVEGMSVTARLVPDIEDPDNPPDEAIQPLELGLGSSSPYLTVQALEDCTATPCSRGYTLILELSEPLLGSAEFEWNVSLEVQHEQEPPSRPTVELVLD